MGDVFVGDGGRRASLGGVDAQMAWRGSAAAGQRSWASEYGGHHMRGAGWGRSNETIVDGPIGRVLDCCCE